MFSARVIQVFIASPSDLPEERDAIRAALADWNALNAESTNLVLLPRTWESHSRPSLARSAQDSINADVLEQSDLAVCCFWTRLGSPTQEYSSGTIEEIERSIRAGRPVLLYFSDRPVVPGSVDPDQFASVMAFKASAFRRGLCGSFDSPASLRVLLMDDLTRATRALRPPDDTNDSVLMRGSVASMFETPGEAIELARRRFARTAFELVARWESVSPELWVVRPRRSGHSLDFVWEELGSSVGQLAPNLGYEHPLLRDLRDHLVWFRNQLDSTLAPIFALDFPAPELDLRGLYEGITDYVRRARLLAELDWHSVA